MAEPHPSETRYRNILSNRRKGETLRALADRTRVNHNTLYYWHQKLARCGRDEEPKTQDLVEVEFPALRALSPIVAPGIEVLLRDSGHVLRVPSRFDADALRQLVDVLERQ